MRPKLIGRSTALNITDIGGSVALANGVAMPYLGVGTYHIDDDDEAARVVGDGLAAGYRLIDTAAFYGNEIGVGRAIRQSGVPRKDIFITSKVWNTDQGFDSTLRAFDASMRRLQIEILDLYLIHWPGRSRYKDTWKALERLYREKRVRAIGVSNFLKHHLEDLISGAQVVPMVDQVEFHPYLLQPDLLRFCRQHDIQPQAWGPLMRGRVGEVPLMKALGEKYGKTPFQLVLRWDLQKGIVTIPKSVQRKRMVSNADIFDFEIAVEDMAQIDGLDKSYRLGPDPDTFDF
jgi:diketogulonate reductase-like aldo/keto reductase